MAVKEIDEDKKLRNYWCLTQEAIDNGRVQSTTRYRKANNNKKTMSSEPSASAGHAFGQMSRKVAGMRIARTHQTQEEQLKPPYSPSTLHQQSHPFQSPLQADNSFFSLSEFMPCPISATVAPMANIPADTTYSELGGNQDMIGCTKVPSADSRLFGDITESGPDCSGSGMEQLDWY